MKRATWSLTLFLPGCLCSSVIDPDPGLLEPDAGPGECEKNEDCDDGVDCTEDVCGIDRTCVRTASQSRCDPGQICWPSVGCIDRRPCDDDADCLDANVCNGNERCDLAAEGGGTCVPGEAVPCDDSDPCNGTEVCDRELGCTPGAPPCSDGVDCTVDTCTGGQCASEPDHGACQDGKACNGTEQCDPVAGCLPGQPPCVDDSECTVDQCAEGEVATCLNLPDHRLCPPTELCSPVGEVGYECQVLICSDSSDCDDGESCNGVEVCVEDSCQPGPPMEDCDDGNFCDGMEICADGECMEQPPPSCFDGVDCTEDSCDPVANSCLNNPVDAACQDEWACDGTERCTAAGCAEQPLECDDGNECTADVCLEPDGCSSTPIDRDEDGYGDIACGGTDCDDQDPLVFPGAQEICDGLDDNCDYAADETLDCVLGQVYPCTTTCDSQGTATCKGDCTLDVCEAPPESCGNGLDDNCDAQEDEGCGCETTGSFEDCPTACGTTGTRTCQGDGQWSPCVPPAEECNNADDDCDTAFDEDFECRLGSLGQCTNECGASGWRGCQPGCVWGDCVVNEVCNGHDDDCDTLCDEGYSCCMGEPQGGCETPCNSGGQLPCTEQCGLGGCTPPAEACNAADDDCDGFYDEDFACELGAYQQCTTGGIWGHLFCEPDCNWSLCCADDELCDVQGDNDCDPTTNDSDPDCCLGGTGLQEVCNGRDDDCDGLCDENGQCCARWRNVFCRTACNTLGRRDCNANCTWGDCTPPQEQCDNWVDDDCDGQIDEREDCWVLE